MASIEKITHSLFEGMKPREREILEGRFGIGKNKEPETLAALGKKYKVTRERIRQIEASALSLLRKKAREHKGIIDIIERSKKHLKNSHGVAKKEGFIDHHRSSVGDIGHNHLGLIIEISNGFGFYPEDENFWAFYYLDKHSLKMASDFVESFVRFLRPHKEKVLEGGGYEKLLESFAGREGMVIPQTRTYVEISKKFYSNPFGDSGLAEWPEIYPRVTRDQIYLILKKKRTPLHFEAIARLINDSGFDRGREALTPTVHNELIKDPRFVLVGRGIYGLSEHGYEPGTVREVIERILKKNGPMKPKDILEQVNKERILKPNTIMINLQNRSYFERLPDGRYRVRA